MQKITLIGRLTRDARIFETQNKNKFVAFTIAVNSRNGNADKATYYDVRQFNFNERMATYFTKGCSLVVVGELDASIDENNGKNYLRLSVLADSIDFNSNGSSSGETQQNETKPVSVTETTIPQNNSNTGAVIGDPNDDDEPIIKKRNNVKTVAPVEDTDSEDLPF